MRTATFELEVRTVDRKNRSSCSCVRKDLMPHSYLVISYSLAAEPTSVPNTMYGQLD